METHTPYHHIPNSYKSNTDFVPPNRDISEKITPKEEPKTRRMYYDAAKFLSDRYQELFDNLIGEMDYIITVADHGESLGEGGRWEHSTGLWPELTHIPLVISGNDINNTKRDRPVNLLDVHRTITEIADVEAETRGRHLIDEIEPRDLLQESYNAVNENNIANKENLNTTPLRGIITGIAQHAFETRNHLENGAAVR